MDILNFAFILILIFSIFFVITQFNNNVVNIDESVAKRLRNIKNKVFLTKKNESLRQQQFKAFFSSDEYRILFIGAILNRLKSTEKLKRMLKTADIKITVDILLLMSAGIFSFFFFLGLVIPANSVAFTVIGIILSYSPFLMIRMRIKKRHELFSQQFPDALGLISSALRAGHSLSSSFALVINEMPEPTSQVFKVVVDDISLGRDTRDALDNMSNYMPESVDLRFFITAVLIQREIGGNLAEILDNLGHTIRERFKLIGQLNAQTAQAKMSGIVLALAPVAIGLLIWVMNPSYMKPLFENIMGQMALAMAVTMGFIGFLCIKQITNIKI
ncbi:MAG: type II secretion system F family protein [bacterium]